MERSKVPAQRSPAISRAPAVPRKAPVKAALRKARETRRAEAPPVEAAAAEARLVQRVPAPQAATQQPLAAERAARLAPTQPPAPLITRSQRASSLVMTS